MTEKDERWARASSWGSQRCSADEAFEILVRVSQRENRKLREVAEELVAKVQQAKRPKRRSD